MPFRLPIRIAVLVFVFVALAVSAQAEPGWPGLRGPSFDGAVHDARLLQGDSAALEVGWKRHLGSGYSAVAVADGRVVTMFAEGDADVAAAFDTESGEELWRYRVADTYAGHDGSHDGPISTPLLAGGRVFGLGPRGHLFALDATDGKPLWTANLVDDHGAEKPHYGFTTSPLLVDGVLVVEIGAGEGKSIAGFGAEDGSLLWTLGDDEIHYHSPVVVRIGGQPVVLAAGSKTLFGIEAASGKALFSYEHQGDDRAMGGGTIVPLAAGEDRVFLMNKIDESTMLGIVKTKSDYEVEQLWSSNSIRSSYVTPVYHDGYLYGMSNRIFTCVDAATGETKWRSRQPGDGFPTLVGDHLVIITKPGTLHVAEASPEGYQELAALELFDEHSWSAVAFAGGRLYARSMAQLARIDVASVAGGKGASNSWIAQTEFGRFLAQVEAADDKVSVVDAYLAGQNSFPIIEDGGAVHFVYRGDAEDVGIVGDMIGFRREDPMTRVDGTDLFYYSTRLEPDAASTYGFIPSFGDPVADPLNSRPGNGLFGEVSWFSMPAWQSPTFVHDAEPARQGRLEAIEWQSEIREGQTRLAQVYLPAGYDADAGRRYPVLYVHDATSALEDGLMKNALDNLIGETVEPLIAVFVIPDGENPRRDVGDVEPYTEMVVTELVPLIDEKYRTIAEPMARGAAGGGRGGGAAMFGVFKYPEVFARAGSHSALVDLNEARELVGSADEQPLVLYQDWGTYHMRSPHEAWSQVEESRGVWALLRERGYRPAGGEVPEGFGWACWRGHTDELLTALFPLRSTPE